MRRKKGNDKKHNLLNPEKLQKTQINGKTKHKYPRTEFTFTTKTKLTLPLSIFQETALSMLHPQQKKKVQIEAMSKSSAWRMKNSSIHGQALPINLMD